MNKQIKMQFGFVELAVVPVRSESSDRAEMSTQLMFGDLVEVYETSGNWFRIRNWYDGYEGWIDAKQIRLIGREEYTRLTSAGLYVNRELVGDAVMYSGMTVRLAPGSSFYDLKGRVMQVDEQQYVILATLYPFRFDSSDQLIDTAMSFLSSSYLWGGKTFMGMDCSGLTQVVYKQHGIKLYRDAAQQASQGELVSFLSDGRPGDLAFFDNADGKIVHVGILLDHQKILHCSGKVRIDDIDHQGIYNRELGKYTHSLRLIKRMGGA